MNLKQLMSQLPDEVQFAIEMESYDRFNTRIATINDSLLHDSNDYYTKEDLKDLIKLQRQWELQTVKDYLKGKEVYTKEYLDWIKQHYFLDKEVNN